MDWMLTWWHPPSDIGLSRVLSLIYGVLIAVGESITTFARFCAEAMVLESQGQL